MQKLTEYMVNESTEFSKLENNPLVYTIIIPRIVVTGDPESVKKDEAVKNAVDATEKFIKDNLSPKTVKALTTAFRPAAVLEMFKLSKNYKTTFDAYFADFTSVICNDEPNFRKCMELDKKMKELFDSPEYLAYRNTL